MYVSSEHSANDNNKLTIVEKDVCLICWTPSEKDNQIKLLSDFSHIIFICKCQPKIHQKCLDIWIYKNSSCPICRRKITVSSLKSGNAYFISCYIYCVEYTVRGLRILCYVSFVNLLFLCFYNIYSIYIVASTYNSYDDYGLY